MPSSIQIINLRTGVSKISTLEKTETTFTNYHVNVKATVAVRNQYKIKRIDGRTKKLGRSALRRMIKGLELSEPKHTTKKESKEELETPEIIVIEDEHINEDCDESECGMIDDSSF